MPAITCTSNEEPLCVTGYEHDWGEAEHNPQNVCGDLTYPGKHWRCKHCLWSRSIKYPGVDEYWKNVPLDYRIGWPESPTLCVTCMKRPRTGRSARCPECENKVYESGGGA